MNERILEEIAMLERANGVRVLYACESGSRAWGFASPDSDYDVRFMYVQERDNYLSIRDRRDVIERPVDAVLDIGGWDLRKTLQLFLKSNATLYEWLQSPIVYREEGGFAGELRGLMHRYFSGRAGCHHYLSMARNVLVHDLAGGQVKLKKYFYALRPLLAAAWIIERGGAPPMQFGELRHLVADSAWQAAVDRLLEEKRVSDERAMIAPVPVLQDWIAVELERNNVLANEIAAVHHEADEMDILFRKYIGL